MPWSAYIFASHGYPEVLVSDGGTNYTSREFSEFCEERNIEHKTSSSYHHASNGQAERMIKTVKNTLNGAIASGESPWTALMHLRTTPLDRNIPSPAVLMGKNIRNMLPNVKLAMTNSDLVRDHLISRQNEMKEKYDRLHNIRELPSLLLSQEVLVRDRPMSRYGRTVRLSRNLTRTTKVGVTRSK